jgi:hypothetical protein
MIRASLIGLAAAAALAASASTASAGVDWHISVGAPGFGYNPYYSPYYSPYPAMYDDDCHYIKVKKWVKKNGVKKKIWVNKLVCY